jgi:hypothetical protein
MNKYEWKSVNTEHPCPICKKTKWCRYTACGQLAGCMRVAEGSFKITPKGCHLHRLAESPNQSVRCRREPIQPRKTATTTTTPAEDWSAFAETYRSALTDERAAQLANALGVPMNVLSVLRVGYLAEKNTFTLPEHDGAGTIIGIGLRHATSGKKWHRKGGKRGLSIPTGWVERTGSIFLVEGASDTLTLTAAGLAAIGRPSNTGGVEPLAALLADVPPDRSIVVVGENDRKEEGAWPGKKGAQQTAEQLAQRLNRPILWAMPPEQYKDVRAWLTDAKSFAQPWAERGATIAEYLEQNADAVHPSVELAKRVKGLLATQGSAALFRNEDLLTELAQLLDEDANEFAAIVAENKKHLSDRILRRAVQPYRTPREPKNRTSAPDYFVDETTGTLCRRVNTDEGESVIGLTNFNARITAERIRNDGIHQQRFFVLTGRAGARPLPPVEVPAEEFSALEWVAQRWGTDAILNAGPGIRDHARAAIHYLSTNIDREMIFGHTGWIELDGAMVYLHAGGAIGAARGPDNLRVELDATLQRYSLPTPPTGAALRSAVQASLRWLELATYRITVPLLAGVYRSVIQPAEVSLFLAGQTGTFKSETAALLLQHFGTEWRRAHLIGFNSTANALGRLRFLAKDVLLVIDDFAPNGSLTDAQRDQRRLDDLTRSQGNGSGRQRLNANCELRDALPPRGSLLLTGEDTGRMASANARMLILHIEPGDVVAEQLSLAQQAAGSGQFALAMAGFIQWLAPTHRERLAGWSAEMQSLRAGLTGAGHARTATNLAELLAAWYLLIEFAQHVGAIPADQVEDYRERGQLALLEAAHRHDGEIQAVDPIDRFLELVSTALRTGRAHLTDPLGSAPPTAERWGWRKDHDWEPIRAEGKIGVIVDEHLYLDPQATFAVMQRLAQEQSNPFHLALETLGRRLRERELLASTPDVLGRATVRKRFGGQQSNYWHLRSATIASTPGKVPTNPVDSDGE